MAEVSTSVLMVDKDKAVRTFYDLEVAKTDFFHIDVMDGKFVKKNNRKQMKEYALEIKHISNIPLDVHLMVENIKENIEDYIPLEPDRITFHIEAVKDKEEALEIIRLLRDNNIKIGVAIKPDTPLKDIYEIIEYVHMVLVMTVEPGKGGQELIKDTIKKVEVLNEYTKLNDLEIDIEVDGGINKETAILVKDAGANILVSGKYITESDNFKDSIESLKN